MTIGVLLVSHEPLGHVMLDITAITLLMHASGGVRTAYDIAKAAKKLVTLFQ